MTHLEAFLATVHRLHKTRTRTTLETETRVNGGDTTMTRAAVIEKRVQNGAKLSEVQGETVLMNPDGSYLHSTDITKTALNYAAFLLTNKS